MRIRKVKYVIAGLVLLFAAFQAYAWDYCPFGLVQDAYAIECGRNVDINADNINIHSQTMPATSVYMMAATTGAFSTTTITLPDPAQPAAQKPVTGEYNFILISAVLLIVYFLSDYLSRRGILLSGYTHRRIWNVLLFFTFLAAGITGILLTLRLDLRWEIPFIKDVTYWHVETGLAMTIIAFFHLAWHWKYYLSMLGVKKEK